MVMLESAFSEQLLACLDECARGRRGLFSESVSDQDEGGAWPKLHGSANSRSPCSRSLRNWKNAMRSATNSLDLCTIHGESHPGERRLARAFLERIERGRSGHVDPGGKKPW